MTKHVNAGSELLSDTSIALGHLHQVLVPDGFGVLLHDSIHSHTP